MIEFFDELFRERELILRSQGRVHFLPLTRRLQMGGFLIAVAIGVWGIGMTLMSTVKSGIIHVKNDEIREARVAYEDLFEEVLRYQKKVATVTSNLRASQVSLLEQIGGVGRSDAKNRKNSKSKTPGGTDKADGNLREHLAAIDTKVQVMTETNTLLEGSLQKIKTELKLAGDERDNIIKTRTKLRERVAELEEFLIKSRTETAYLERRAAGLADSLSVTRTKHDSVVAVREQLKDRVASLELGLKDANGRTKNAELDLNKVLEKLEQTTGSDSQRQLAAIGDDNDELNANVHPGPTVQLRKRTVSLLQRLDDLHAAQGNVLNRLGERTVKNIESAERLIVKTGLNLEKVLARATDASFGQGGPLIEISAGDIDGLPGSVSEIDNQLTKWAGLRRLLQSVPLISPVDYYHQASDFGLRRDPFTKKRAMHYGVDLAGWRGAPIYSTAPGRVVYAGRKGRYGKMVEIDHGYGVRTRFGHLLKVLVKTGQEVGHRHNIALLGSTGRSTGPHVHYEIRFDGKPLDPERFIKAGRYVFKE